jgi:hypothetical protein
MLAAALFIAAGFACGVILRFGAFAIGVAAFIAGYGLLIGSVSASWKALAIELLLALLFLQVGYVGAAVARIFLTKLKALSPGLSRRHASPHVARARNTDNSPS